MIFNLNHKGQLGKIITSFPVFISIFVIIVIYLVFVAAVYGIKGANVPSSIKGIELSNVLFNDIEVDGEKMSFLDGIIRADNYLARDEKIQEELLRASGIERERLLEESRKHINYMSKVKDALKNKLEKENSGETCFMLFQGPGNIIRENIKLENNEKDIYYRFKDGKGEKSPAVIDMEFYYKEGHFNKLSSFTVKSDSFERGYAISYYYGGCLR